MAEIISYEELKQLIDSKSKFILLDVRERMELLNGIIPTSRNVPLSELEGATSLQKDVFFKKYGFALNPDLLIVTYCRTGKRSHTATELLLSKGFKVKSFEGSIQEWSKHDSKVKMY